MSPWTGHPVSRFRPEVFFWIILCMAVAASPTNIEAPTMSGAAMIDITSSITSLCDMAWSILLAYVP